MVGLVEVRVFGWVDMWESKGEGERKQARKKDRAYARSGEMRKV